MVRATSVGTALIRSAEDTRRGAADPRAPRRRRIVIHVGPPKTATTTFQALLRRNAERIAPHAAVSAKDRLTLNLRGAAKPRRTVPEWLRRFLVRQSARQFAARVGRMPFQTLIVSDENLLGFLSATLFRIRYDEGPRQVVEALDRALADYDLQFVGYLREPRSWLRSCHNQATKRGLVAEDADRWMAAHEDLDGPRRLLDEMARHLGDRFRMVDMEAEIAADGQIGRAVLALAGVPDAVFDSLERPGPENQSLGPSALRLVELVNDAGLPEKHRRTVTRLIRDNPQLFARQPRSDAPAPGGAEGRSKGVETAAPSTNPQPEA